MKRNATSLEKAPLRQGRFFERLVGIRWRIFLYFLLFTGLLLLLLWLFQIVFLDEFYHWQKERLLCASSESIVRNIDNENVESLVQRISEQNTVCILITDASMGELYAAEAWNGCILHHMGRHDLRRYAAQTKAASGVTVKEFPLRAFRNQAYDARMFQGRVPPSDMGDARSLLTVQRARRASGESVYIFLNTLITPVDGTVQTIQNQLLLITAILVLLSFLLSLVLSRRITRPLVETTRAAAALSHGEYEPVARTGYREIESLNRQLCQTARDLRRAEAMQQELIANISHDLRTPLTLIEGYAEAMRDLPDENTPENMQVIIDETKRLSTLVNAVLDLHTARENESHPTRFNLTACVRGIIARYAKLTQQDGFRIVFEPEEEVWVTADEVKVQQVLYNLMNNALTYTGADRTITVRQVAAAGRVRMEVCDSGEGIAQQDLPYIWDRYYRGGKPHKRAAVGSGLGLSIVKKILEGDGLPYGVQSTEGEGSTFWFELSRA